MKVSYRSEVINFDPSRESETVRERLSSRSRQHHSTALRSMLMIISEFGAVTIDISNDGHEADDEDKLEEPVGKLQVRGRPNLSVSQSDLA